MTTRRVKLVGKKEFAAAALDPEYETYVVHIGSLSSDASLSFSLLDVHPSCRPQISGLIIKETLAKVPIKYLNFTDIFSLALVSKLPKHTKINDHVIKLINSQQPPYGLIYGLGLVELETLKAYLETSLANGFIRPSKLPAGAPILFDWKSNSSFKLYVNYRGLNNLMIKNWYPLPLIVELLDRLKMARQFTQFDLISAYHQMKIRKGNK